jgi:hypothetical protein
MNVYVGGDVSKGYADFCLTGGEGEILLEIQLDDTRQGHSRMSELIRECRQKVSPQEELEVALEATGGMELNWLDLFRRLDETSKADLEVYRFNPLVIRRFAEQNLPRNKTDEISARVRPIISAWVWPKRRLLTPTRAPTMGSRRCLARHSGW